MLPVDNRVELFAAQSQGTAPAVCVASIVYGGLPTCFSFMGFVTKRMSNS